MCIEGSFIIEANNEKTVVNKGDTVLIPACIDEVGLTPHDKVTLLEVHV
jgi:mannose-6-phosphate isomerase